MGKKNSFVCCIHGCLRIITVQDLQPKMGPPLVRLAAQNVQAIQMRPPPPVLTINTHESPARNNTASISIECIPKAAPIF